MEQDLLLSLRFGDHEKEKRRYSNWHTSMADIVLLIDMVQFSPKGGASIAIYSFDFLVVALIIFSFCRRMKGYGIGMKSLE